MLRLRLLQVKGYSNSQNGGSAYKYDATFNLRILRYQTQITHKYKTVYV